MSEVTLPALLDKTLPALNELTQNLMVPRDVIASELEIQNAWTNLPGILTKIPPELRSESMARMCIAIAAGLFDSAINYIWNAAVIELREKVKRFGLPVVQQLLERASFDEKALLDLKDAELLNLCLELNLVTEDGYFFLDQCRDIRNNFSAAHPVVGKIDDFEFIAFANRCAKYALGTEHNPVGVDIFAFMTAIKGGKFTDEQVDQWKLRIQATHAAQQHLLFGSLHGIYSDPSSNEEARVNALTMATCFADAFTPKTKSELINRHQDYAAKGDEKRHRASQQFFERLKMLSLLGEAEIHYLVSNASKRLLSAHDGMNNFYIEPAFAERLLEIRKQTAIPDTAKEEYVISIVTCAVGNPYGVSNAAVPYYGSLIRGFSPAEVEIMFDLPERKLSLSERIKSYPHCRERFRKMVSLIDQSSVPAKVAQSYARWTQ